MFEALLAQSVFFLALMLSLEISRRALIEVAVQHCAFLGARAQLVGQSESSLRRAVTRFAKAALGSNSGAQLASQFERRPTTPFGECKVHFRFASLLRFDWRSGDKHHFETTKSCRFPSTL